MLARKPISLAEHHEILCQLLDLTNQSQDPNLIIYTLHYGSQYYRKVGRFEDATEFLQQALGVCGPKHPLRPQLQNELAVMRSDVAPELEYWIFAKTGPLLFTHTPTNQLNIDEDLFGMFFAALQDFASELSSTESQGMGQKRISQIQWTTGESFLIYHRDIDPLFIVGLCSKKQVLEQVYDDLRSVYLRFFFTFEEELNRFQGNVQPFLNFPGKNFS